MLFTSALVAQDPPPPAAEKLPEVRVDRDDLVITKSCRLVAPKTPVIDANENGLLHVKASGITIEFDRETTLWGADLKATTPDKLTGIGIRIDQQKDVRLVGLRLRGFKVGIYASRADGLEIERADLADLFRHHLRSTPAAEDGADWLWPHENDKNEWMNNYGAAIYIEDTNVVRVGRSKARRGQNGLLLDRVDGARIVDNDFSFLSGWGLGLWRSNRAIVMSNQFDFCVRGYSHGVYNRGQDSAGILIFEQCCNNLFVKNSATHGGDCVFGFGGKEALGESAAPAGFDYKRKGCNDNVFIDNDFSYAPAHGIEMTFSFGSKIIGNRITGNAICGVWGGYSQDTLITNNDFADNGGMGYGLERGGVNIEHGYHNAIVKNRFSKNRCGVHLWGSVDNPFAKKPWGAANYRGCRENMIADNVFEGDELAIHLRTADSTTIARNTMKDVKRDTDIDPQSTITDSADWKLPDYSRGLGPTGASSPEKRTHLAGRENIIMTEWGPWDHESPFLQLLSNSGSPHVYALRGFENPKAEQIKGEVTTRIEQESTPWKLLVTPKRDGVTLYRLLVTHNPTGSSSLFSASGTLLTTSWTLRVFKTSAKPHENPSAWAVDSKVAPLDLKVSAIDFPFGGGAPANVPGLAASEDLKRANIPGNHFGVIADTSIPLRKGKWRLTALSDDGVRVTADGKKVIDNWTWHTPATDTAVIELSEDRTVPIRVEYFELDGHAVLKFDLEPVEAEQKQ
jgi:parallel beta-helix repeat protein